MAAVAMPPAFVSPVTSRQPCERGLSEMRDELARLMNDVPRQEAGMRQITDALDELYLAAIRSDPIDGCGRNVETRLADTMARLEAVPIAQTLIQVNELMQCVVDADERLRNAQAEAERQGNNALALQIRERLGQVRRWDTQVVELGKEVGTLARRQARLLDHGRDAVDRCLPDPFQ